jgi:hypothetical protein
LLVVLTGLLLGLVAFNWGKTSATRAAQAPAATVAPFDWASVSSRDLKIAKIFLTARDIGITAAMDSLDQVATADSSFVNDAHMIAHGLGRFAIANNRNDPSVLSKCRPTYQAGCYHGVLEGYMTSLPRVDAAATTQLCSKLLDNPSSRFDGLQCAHGLGHGFLEAMKYKLSEALVACDAFSERDLQRECYDGIFMENVVHGLGMSVMEASDKASNSHTHMMAQAVPTMTTFRASDPKFPCDSVGASYQTACWGYQPLIIARLASYDYAKTLVGCGQAPTESAAYCYRGVGKQSIAWFAFDLRRVASMCATAGSRENDCLAGGVEVLVDFTMKPDRAVELCRLARSAVRSACFGHIGERLVRIHSEPAKIAKACSLAGKAEYVDACIRGASQQ